MRGDRKDGRLVRDDADPMHLFIPYIMPMRSESEVYLNETVDVTNLLAFLEKKNENAVEGSFHMTMFHVVVSAVSKTILHRPYMNRFIAGRRLYQRDVVTSSFVVKKRFKDEGEEGVMILKTDGDSTLDQVAHKIYGDVKETREEGNSVDGVLKALKKCP
ncbi:MAG: 2-oxo acid dehydrogenase subunit E2, partial [Anaerovoracaceae bacterium]|nr:2-oxo acid dehydrogenase subunit E2 [Anaerovoracaceae bacterium]